MSRPDTLDNLAAMVAYTTDMRAIGSSWQPARGCRNLLLDLNDRTRSFQKRIQPRSRCGNMAQAGNFPAHCTL